MKGPLIERLPPGAPELRAFDATVEEHDHRRAVTVPLQPSSEKRYARCFRRYEEWCSSMGYQSSPEFIDSEKVREFTVYMTKEARYAPRTIWITLRALELYSERAGLAVSVEAAHGVLDSYRASLAPHGEAKAPGRARRRRSRWVH